MRIIGITGPTGAGKSLLGSYLKDLGIPLIDADALYHQMLIPPSKCLELIRDSFGNSVLRCDGTLDRAALGAIVFNSEEKLALLNSTVLSTVLEEIRRIIAEYESKGFDTVTVDAPTLIESGFHRECTVVISVLAPKELRAERIQERDSLTPHGAELRIAAQKDDSFYIESSHYILINSGDSRSFMSEARSILKSIGITD